MLENIDFGLGEIIYIDSYMSEDLADIDFFDIGSDILTIRYPNNYEIDLGFYGGGSEGDGFFRLLIKSTIDDSPNVFNKTFKDPNLIEPILTEAIKIIKNLKTKEEIKEPKIDNMIEDIDFGIGKIRYNSITFDLNKKIKDIDVNLLFQGLLGIDYPNDADISLYWVANYGEDGLIKDGFFDLHILTSDDENPYLFKAEFKEPNEIKLNLKKAIEIANNYRK